MNNKWAAITVGSFSNGDHYNFNKNILALARQNQAIEEHCASILTAYATAMEEEDEAMVHSLKQPFSAELREQDDIRDARYYNISETARAMAKWPIVAIAQAAQRVMECLKTYKVNPQENINKETGVLDNLLQELQGQLAGDIATLGLTEIVAQLKAANEETNRLYMDRFAENANRVNARVQKAREEVDAQYQALREKVNALVVVFGATDYSDFIGTVNQYILDAKRRVLKLTSVKKTEVEVEEVEEEETEEEGGNNSEGGSTSEGGNQTGGSGSNGGSTGTGPNEDWDV